MSLQNLFWVVLRIQEFPFNWKLANVPAFKKGKEDPGNYRPVILTSMAVKIMEKVILGDTEKLS